MKNVLGRINGSSHYGQRGFTLIELLIVIAVVGVLAGAAVPNVTGFLTAGKVQAANTEAANVETAAHYNVITGAFPADSDVAAFGDFASGALKTTYVFDSNTGKISNVKKKAGGWPGVLWDLSDHKWVKGDDSGIAVGENQTQP